MNKAKEIFKKVWIEHFGQNDEMSRQLKTILDSHDYIFEAMEQYAQQRERETAIEFHRWRSDYGFSLQNDTELFNEWKQQEDKS